MTVDLTLTNTFLGVIAFAYLLQGVAIAGTVVGGVLLYRRVAQLLARLEEQQVRPAAQKVNAILDDVKTVTTTVRIRAEHVDGALDAMAAMFDRLRRRHAA